jgi:hypothetical protein
MNEASLSILITILGILFFAMLSNPRATTYALLVTVGVYAVYFLCAPLLPRLLKLNAMRTDKMPELTYGQVSSVELSEVADYVSKLMGVGAILPDPGLEGHLRSLGDLPEPEPLL